MNKTFPSWTSLQVFLRRSLKKSSPAAFTLIELLVVVAIVVLLVALIFPAVGDIKKEAIQTKCVHNLRESSAAIALWAQDHNNTFIPSFSKISTNDGSSVWFRTYSSLGNYTEGPEQLQKITVCPLNLTNGPVGPPVNHELGFPYLANYNVMVIQTDDTGYSSSQWVRVSAVRQPTKTVLLVDSKTGAEWPAPGFSGNSSFSRIGTPHSGRANVLWCDGHVSAEFPTNLINNLIP